MLLKHVVLIMQTINIIINMDDIRLEKPNEDPILKLNKRLKQMALWYTHQGIYGVSGLEKINNIAFLEV